MVKPSTLGLYMTYRVRAYAVEIAKGSSLKINNKYPLDECTVQYIMDMSLASGDRHLSSLDASPTIDQNILKFKLATY
jgi:hypothetical protein